MFDRLELNWYLNSLRVAGTSGRRQKRGVGFSPWWVGTMFFIFLVFSVFFLSAKNAQAYLDPGAGSYVIQVLIAMGIAAAVGLKLFWAKITGFFRSSDEKSDKKSQ